MLLGFAAHSVHRVLTNASPSSYPDLSKPTPPFSSPRLVACLLIQVIFTSAMFIVKGGYVQAGILLAVLSLSLYGLRR